MSERVRWSHLQDDELDGDTYYDLLANFNADKAEYCRAVDTEGCACTPHPDLPGCNLINRWCREHGILATVPAELTMSDSGIRGGEPCMINTRVPVEDVSTLLEDGANWDFVKETYPSIPAPASGMPHTPAQDPAPAVEDALAHIRECLHIGLQGAKLYDEAGTKRIGEWADFIDKQIREALEMPCPAAQPLASGPETASGQSGRGTGDREAHARSEGHWLKFDTIAREITGCECGFRTDMDSDCGWGDSVVAHLLEVGADASRPAHYREAANSLRGYALTRQVGDTYGSGFVDGITAAADRLESYARDLSDPGEGR